jgi:hypothetical protein
MSEQTKFTKGPMTTGELNWREGRIKELEAREQKYIEALQTAAKHFRFWAKAKENDGQVSSAETLTYYAQACEIAADEQHYDAERKRRGPPNSPLPSQRNNYVNNY